MGQRPRNVHVRPDCGRGAELPRARRLCKIAASPLSYVRGSTVRFYVLGIDADAAHTTTVEHLDAACWIKGCSSLGRLRMAGLVRAAGPRDQTSLALIDVKAPVPYLAPTAPGGSMPSDPADRIVAGGRALSPALGERMVAARIGSTPVVVREFLPLDLKIVADQFSKREGVRVAHSLAIVVGRAHGPQLPSRCAITGGGMSRPVAGMAAHRIGCGPPSSR